MGQKKWTGIAVHRHLPKSKRLSKPVSKLIWIGAKKIAGALSPQEWAMLAFCGMIILGIMVISAQ